MKATELMIGDWVMYNPNVFIDDEYEPYKEWEKIRILSGEDFELADEDCYGPIPLTPEILEKNGFEFVSDSTIAISSTKLLDIHTSIHFQFINGKSAFVRLHHCGAGSYEFSKHIQSVHELQHALRLCGLNDLADNFKV